MNEELEKQKITSVIKTWIEASAAEDLDKVLSLMAEDVVFLLPGQPPMKGRNAFAAASRASKGKIRIEGKSDVQEIKIFGDYAYCWNFLSLTITPLQGGEPKKRSGNILSIFRKEADGRWVMFRDANLLTGQ